MAPDAQQRSEIARLGGLARTAAAPSGTAMTETARRAFRDSFYNATDPELPARERERQAEAAYRAHMLELSRKARAARRARAKAALLRQAADVLLEHADAL